MTKHSGLSLAVLSLVPLLAIFGPQMLAMVILGKPNSHSSHSFHNSHLELNPLQWNNLRRSIK